ncbi:hypothetical protein BX666DRAFT_1881976 [Dichotomocladium elegans]|nr:hypothetical protein BX666DRAFT_1881976 [Dichotomocladium elegans]
MVYSFDFAAQVTRICMDEIRRRGLQERKILRKSAPSMVLFLKVFREQRCTPDDVTHVSIHSVATLMQDTLWCCQERIVPKTVWRVINYETCTLSSLSRNLTYKGEQLLIEILDFLVELMQHKGKNLMDAYHLGEAMGKVTLGPADCDPIIAEKANHFLTRMIIEHSKRIHFRKFALKRDGRIDSGIGPFTYTECMPMSKNDAAMAKRKSYDRLIRRIHHASHDWAAYTPSIRAMLDNEYEPEEMEPAEPWISIFETHLEQHDPSASPLLFRIVAGAMQAPPPVPKDPFIYLSRDSYTVDSTNAFSEFKSLCGPSAAAAQALYASHAEKVSHFKKINHSLSHMKLNLRKQQQQQQIHTRPLQEDYITEETTIRPDYDEDISVQVEYEKKQKHVKSMVRRVMKMNSRKQLNSTVA